MKVGYMFQILKLVVCVCVIRKKLVWDIRGKLKKGWVYVSDHQTGCVCV